MVSKSIRGSDKGKGAILKIQVTPRASRNGIIKVLEDGTVKILLTAPPVEGKANEALKKFLSKTLDIPISHIDILAGESGRYKTILIKDMNGSLLRNKILEHVG
jgi:uncharacterized protein (TIGR00251 family)